MEIRVSISLPGPLCLNYSPPMGDSPKLPGMPDAARFAAGRPVLATLLGNVFDRAATTSSEQRRTAAMLGGAVPADFAAYFDKVVRHAYKVTDEDIAALKAAGHSEDEILELTVAAAMGAALVRLDRGLGALRAAAKKDG